MALIFVISAMLVGTALRCVHLGDVPPALNQDEVVNGYDAYSLFMTGRDHHGHPFPFAGLESFGDWASPLLTFATVPFVAVMGLRAEAVRAATAAIGVAGIPLMYGVGRELFGRRVVGVVAAWYFAVSPWCVHRAHFAIPPSIVPTMLALTLFALAWTMNRGSARGTVATALAAAMTIAAYPTMKLYVPLLLAAALVIYWRRLPDLNAEAVAYGVALFVVIAGPIFYISIFDPGGRARLDQVSIFRTTTPVTPVRLAREYVSYVSPTVFFRSGNGHPAQTPTPPGRGIEPRTMAPFLAVGLAALLTAVVPGMRSRIDRRSALLVLVALALFPIPGSLTLPTPPASNPHLSRAVQVIPLLALVVGVGVMCTGEFARRAVDRVAPRRRAVILGAAGVVAAALVARDLAVRYRDYFGSYARRDEVLHYFQYGLDRAIEYARAHESEYDEIWMDDMNQPYVYVLFYERWSPDEVHRVFQPRRAPPSFNGVDTIGKYHFGALPDGPGGLATLATIKDPNGKSVYEIRGGAVHDRGRVLLIHAP